MNAVPDLNKVTAMAATDQTKTAAAPPFGRRRALLPRATARQATKRVRRSLSEAKA